jgi:hypothetical protein
MPNNVLLSVSADTAAKLRAMTKFGDDETPARTIDDVIVELLGRPTGAVEAVLPKPAPKFRAKKNIP